MNLELLSIFETTLKRLKKILTSITPYSAPAAAFALGVLVLDSSLLPAAVAQCGGVSGSCAEPDFDPSLIQNSVGNLFMLIEGAFGALIMVVAGLGAIVAASMGAYRAAVGMLVVAVGAFILRALVSLFFGLEYVGWTDSNI